MCVVAVPDLRRSSESVRYHVGDDERSLVKLENRDLQGDSGMGTMPILDKDFSRSILRISWC